MPTLWHFFVFLRALCGKAFVASPVPQWNQRKIIDD
jgi:hypothetical protein